MSESRKVWMAFRRELTSLEEQIALYEKENMAQFEIKVHGIKGAARQLGDKELSTYAELMEKAARERDKDYLDAHMAEFVQQLAESRKYAEEKLQMLQLEEKDEEPQRDTIYELFTQLKQGFERYDIDMVEDRLLRLERHALTPREQKLLQEVQELCDNLEYEAGSELLKHYKSC